MFGYDSQKKRARAALETIVSGQAFITRRHGIVQEVKKLMHEIGQLEDEIVRNRELELTLSADSSLARSAVETIEKAQRFRHARQRRIEELRAEDETIKQRTPQVGRDIAAAKDAARAVFDELLAAAQKGNSDARKVIDALDWMPAGIAVPVWH